VNRTLIGAALPSLAISGVMIVALGLVACNGSGALSPAGTLPATARTGAVPAANPSPTPYWFTFQTVDRPGATFNRVTGIDDALQITGYEGSGTPSDPAESYRAKAPYTAKQFLKVIYPEASDTFAMGLGNDYVCVGYFVSSVIGEHTYGFVRSHGIYSFYANPDTPKGPKTVNELLGVNDYDAAVGFYTDGSGKNHAYELYVNQGSYTPLKPSGFTSTEAAGINDPGSIVGFGVRTDGSTAGWIYLDGAFSDITYPNAKSTEALGINYQNQVSGEYTDSAGVTHGFVVTNVTHPDPIWQSVDEPNASGTTVINSMNDRHAIAGWYVDSAGTTNGFTATVDINTCVANEKCHTKR
jgi:hypothetical protein